MTTDALGLHLRARRGLMRAPFLDRLPEPPEWYSPRRFGRARRLRRAYATSGEVARLDWTVVQGVLTEREIRDFFRVEKAVRRGVARVAFMDMLRPMYAGTFAQREAIKQGLMLKREWWERPL